MRYLFAIVLLFSFAFSFSQEIQLRDDTLSVEYSDNLTEIDFNELPYYKLDGFQQYRPFDRRRLPMARSGNNGLPTFTLSPEKQDWDVDYLAGGFSNYLMTKESIRYYRMSRPFTMLSYMNGAEAEQLFNVLHAQNLGEGLNISFEYQRTVSEGFFIQQLTNHTQFNATYNLESRDHRFQSRGYFIINNLEAQENGGIFLSENNDQNDNTVLLNINLRNAQNQIRTQNVGATNQYALIQKDSANTFIGVSHEFDWTKASRIYKDDTTNSTPSFYDNYFLDKVNSADSSFAERLSNSFNLNFLNNAFSIGYKNEQYHYFQNFLINKSFSSDYIIAGVNGELFNQKVNVILEKGVSGFHEEEIYLATNIDFEDWKGFKTELSISQASKRADYFLTNQRSNHFFFTRDFDLSNFSQIAVSTVKEKWNFGLEIGLQQFDNFIYFNQNQDLLQHKGSITNLYAEVSKNFKFFKNWNFFNRIKYQQISEEKVISLPDLYSYHSLYYENLFFKSALRFQLGLDLYYISEYNGNSYSPALAQFYLSDSESSLTSINQLDVFMNLGINKSARVFVKMENILSNSFSVESYRIQNYPIPGRALKVGFSWRMIN